MKAFLLIFSMGWCLQGLAQQEYFMFLQSESRQPFYVHMGEKNYSSSSTGHLVLSKLKDSAYVITIGFPQNQFPEQEFTVRVSKRDRGFELKNLGEKGWVLFDWQTMELISAPKKAGGTSSGGAGYSLVRKNDDFAKLMASVVNDTAVMYTVVMDEKKQPVLVAKDTVSSDIAKRDTVSSHVAKLETKPVQEPEVKKPEPAAEKLDTVRAVNTVVIKDVAAKDNSVVKDSSSITKEDISVTKNNNAVVKDSSIAKLDPPARKPDEIVPEIKKQDTVKAQEVAKNTEVKKPENEIIVPKKTEPDPMKDSVLNPPALPVIYVVKQFKSDTGYHMVITDELKDSIDIFIPADAPQVKKETDTTAANEVVTDTARKQPKLYMINSDCRAFASQNDVDKLRVKLINEKDSEGRVAAAKKVFKTRCFSALQIKALSEMFPLDEQKYKFLEMAYPFVSDTGNFKGLVSLLQDPVYVQRFRKLVRLD